MRSSKYGSIHQLHMRCHSNGWHAAKSVSLRSMLTIEAAESSKPAWWPPSTLDDQRLRRYPLRCAWCWSAQRADAQRACRKFERTAGLNGENFTVRGFEARRSACAADRHAQRMIEAQRGALVMCIPARLRWRRCRPVGWPVHGIGDRVRRRTPRRGAANRCGRHPAPWSMRRARAPARSCAVDRDEAHAIPGLQAGGELVACIEQREWCSSDQAPTAGTRARVDAGLRTADSDTAGGNLGARRCQSR